MWTRRRRRSCWPAAPPVTFVPLDLTHKALTTQGEERGLRGSGQPCSARVVAGWTRFFERFDVEKYGSEGAPLHDPCVIAYLLAPELFGGRENQRRDRA